ncbi:MAG: hypothetical protein NT123_21785 [Proteobacteria bacterium]|nr:hypothetical protein [Pseudomonadota bacterium]
MRQLARHLMVVLVSLALSGCPFDSNFPLGVPQRHDIDPRLTGYWVWDDPEGNGKKPSILVSIAPFNGAEYLVEWIRENGSEPERFRAFQIMIGDQAFWNVNLVQTSSPPAWYNFVQSTLVNDSLLSTKIVGDKIVPGPLASDASGLRTFLASHLDDPLLYDSESAIWRRPKVDEIKRGRLQSWGAQSAPVSEK